MVAIMRFVSSSSARSLVAQRGSSLTVAARSMHTTPALFKGPPTQSEEAVKHEKHDQSPEELQKQTAQKAQKEFKQDSQTSTSSEESVKADQSSHDPLPDHKKASS